MSTGAYTAPRARPSQPSCSATRRHVFLGSTTRPSCMHHVLEDCPLHSFQRCGRRAERTIDGEPGPRIVLLLLPRDSEALGHRSGIRLSHSACVSAITGASTSRTGSSSLAAAIDIIVTLLPCSRFAKHATTTERDCCNCVSLRPVKETP